MKVQLLEKTKEQNLYEQVAERLRALIWEGTLQPGDRLPSVRKLRQQFSVSISTVLEAYRLLEDEGLITARPQSGYYVKRLLPVPPALPQTSTPPSLPCAVDTSVAFQVRAAMQHPEIIQLGAAISSPDLFPSQALNRLMGQVMRAQPQKVHGYGIPPGCEALRHEVAKRLMDAGCSVVPDQILSTNGTTEAVYLGLRVVTKPGDTVAIESPCYYGLLETLAALHLKALEIPTHPVEGISLEYLETALAQGKVAACALVSNFSNPSGHCMSDQKKKQLVALLTHYQVPLIEDDVYGEIYFEAARPKAIKAFDTEGLVLYCASVSKILSPGLRVGWLVPGRYQGQVELLKIAVNVTTAIAPQLTVAAFLANGGYDRHLRHLRRAYQTQMARMTQAICEYFPPETRVSRPQGGHVLWLELPSHFDSMILYREALEQQISIAPGIIFSPSESYRNCLRLNAGLLWSSELDHAIQTLGLLTKQQLARQFLAQTEMNQ
ncbi:PLP-dependent aminotransferase family protein [Spirulina subsalsa]|uniref:aminotransferase-like domain-containing protein n=1 Tax=Spirulina subsalsa TaxID=54311 RepID=UPI00030D176B|nr:PLP-dependent aminotransferase family protein [Spirulina subsalsa]